MDPGAAVLGLCQASEQITSGDGAHVLGPVDSPPCGQSTGARGTGPRRCRGRGRRDVVCHRSSSRAVERSRTCSETGDEVDWT